MPINPAIALQVKSPEPIDLLGTYGKFSAIQAAQTQNALAQMQMQEYGRARSEEDAIRNRLMGGGKLDDPDMHNLLLSSKTGREILKSETDRRRAALQADKDASDLIDKSMARYRDFAGFVKSKDDAIQLLQTAIADPRMKDSPLTKIPFDQQVNHIPDDPKGLDDWLKMFSLGTTKFDELNKPQLITNNLGRTTETTAFSPLTRQTNKVLTQTNTISPAEAERIGLEGRRVAVLEENARRDADPAFQQRMAGARAVGEAIAKGDVAAVQALPKIIGRAEEGVRLIDELIGKRDSKTGKLIEGSKPHPGFQNAVGATWLPGARFIPGTDAAGFMSRFDQIKGASFLEAFESLKGGGAITEKEGQKGTDAINRMSTSTDEKEFIRAALDLQDVIRKGVENAQKRAARAGGAAPAAPAAPAAGGVKFLGFE